MPRGQYDRTKSKEQRAAEKAVAKPIKSVPGKKRGPKSLKKMASDPAILEGGMVLKSFDPPLHYIQSYITTLATAFATLGGNSDGNSIPVLKELHAAVEIASRMRKAIFGKTEDEEKEDSLVTSESGGGEEGAEEAPAQVATQLRPPAPAQPVFPPAHPQA